MVFQHSGAFARRPGVGRPPSGVRASCTAAMSHEANCRAWKAWGGCGRRSPPATRPRAAPYAWRRRVVLTRMPTC